MLINREKQIMQLVLVGSKLIAVVKLWLFRRVRRECMWGSPLTSV